MDSSVAALRDRYASDRLVVMRRLAKSKEAERMIEESPLWPKQPVYVRPEDGVTWLSQTVPKDSFLGAWLLSDRMLHIVRTVSSNTSALVRTESWTNLYRMGEYIT